MTQPTGVMWVPMPAVGCWIGWLGADAVFWVSDCLLKPLFRRRSKKTPKLRVTSLCEGNSPVTGEFPTQRASNAEKFPFDDVIMGVLEIILQQDTFRLTGCTDKWWPRTLLLIPINLIPVWLINRMHRKRPAKLLILSQTSTVLLLKFGNGKVHLSHTVLWLLIHAEIKFNPCW